MDRSQSGREDAFVPTLFGREEVLKRLVDRLTPPFSAPLVILVEGPAGIGKTSLLWTGLAQAEALGVTTLRASPLESEVSFAYAALRDLLGDQLARFAGQVPELQRLTLQQALGQGTADSHQPASAEQVATAVLLSLRALISAGPTVLAIDDVGWVDQASQDALTFALRRLAGLPLRIVLTHRRDSPAGTLPLGLGDPARPIEIDRIWLEPLSMGALQAALRSATGATFARPTLLRISAISAGNPFYAIELGRALVARGAVVRPGEDLPVPSSLRDLVADRLTNQPARVRKLLLTAAMSSRPTTGLLARRANADPFEALRPAIDASLIRLDGHFVAFAHPLYASTLVAEATNEERLETHSWLGEAEDNTEARARHLALATATVDADVATKLHEASLQARQRGATAVAAELADLSVERTPTNDPEKATRALFAAGLWFDAGALATARERVNVLLPSVTGTDRARALMMDGLCAWYLATPQEASARLLRARADAGDDRELAGLIEYYLSIFLNYDLEAGYEHAIAAASLLRSTNDRGHLGAALLQTFYLSVVLGHRPDPAVLEEGLAIEMEGPLADRLTSPGIWWAATGRLDLARERFQNMLDFDRAYGVFSNTGNLLTRLAEVEIWAGDWKSARSLATAAMDADLETGVSPEEMALRALATVDALEGDLALAEEAAAAGLERSERKNALTLAAAWLQVTALVGASRGDNEAVADATLRAAGYLREVGMPEPLRLDPAPELIDALAALGRVADAERELAELEQRHRRVPKPWAAAAIARATARLALAHDDPAAAMAATDTAVTARDHDGWSRFDLARVLLVRGEALRRARSRRAASEVLHRANQLFVDLGARVWAQRADDELARLGLTRTTSLEMTPTEARVARLAGQGLSTKEVAAELGISPRTVETHLAAVYGKLGVSSRAELGRYVAATDDNSPVPRGP